MKAANTLILGAGLLVALAIGRPLAAVEQDGDGVAVVAGRVITRTRLTDLLMEAHGLAMLQQLTLLELAKAETERRGIKVSQAEVEAEFERALTELATDPQLDRDARVKALKTVAANNGVTMPEFMIGMERNAHLRKLVAQDVKVNEQTLREEFARTFGERVVVRHIQLTDLRKANTVLNELGRGRDFAELAREFSEYPLSAERGGQLDPFTFDDDKLPGALREAAFLLKKGEVSPIVKTGEYYQIIKLEERLPPENVKFEEVRGQVEARLRGRVEQQQMDAKLKELFQPSKVRVLDGRLRKQYEEFLNQMTADAKSPGKP